MGSESFFACGRQAIHDAGEKMTPTPISDTESRPRHRIFN